MNKAILMGRLTRDPEVRYSQSDSSMAIARFSLAEDTRSRAMKPLPTSLTAQPLASRANLSRSI